MKKFFVYSILVVAISLPAFAGEGKKCDKAAKAECSKKAAACEKAKASGCPKAAAAAAKCCPGKKVASTNKAKGAEALLQ